MHLKSSFSRVPNAHGRTAPRPAFLSALAYIRGRLAALHRPILPKNVFINRFIGNRCGSTALGDITWIPKLWLSAFGGDPRRVTHKMFGDRRGLLRDIRVDPGMSASCPAEQLRTWRLSRSTGQTGNSDGSRRVQPHQMRSLATACQPMSRRQKPSGQ